MTRDKDKTSEMLNIKLVPSLTHSLIVGGLVQQIVSNVKEDGMCISHCLAAYP